jgi:hypothetical protein
MSYKEARTLALVKLLHTNGIELDKSDRAIQKLKDWFEMSVEGELHETDPVTVHGVELDIGPQPQLKPIWYSVVNDIGLFLGDVILERAPNLRWEFFTYGRRDLAYQRHVIMGFPVPNPKYTIDVDRHVATYGHRVVAGESNRDDQFVYLVENAVALALGLESARPGKACSRAKCGTNYVVAAPGRIPPGLTLGLPFS